MRNIIQFFKEIEWIGGLFTLVRENWPWLSGITVLVLGLLPASAKAGLAWPLLLWRYVQMTAVNLGWGVYALVFAMTIFAIFGLWFFYLIIAGKISVGNARHWYKRRDLAERLNALAKDVSDLLASHVREEGSARDESGARFLGSSGNDFSRKEEVALEGRTWERFTREHQAEIASALIGASAFIDLDLSCLNPNPYYQPVKPYLRNMIVLLGGVSGSLSDERVKIPQLSDWSGEHD